MNQNPSQSNSESSEEARGRIIASRTEFFSGPFPHPELLKKFEDVLPGAAERIFALTEAQSAHRRELEKKVINSGVTNSRLGTAAGLIIALAIVLAGYKTVELGQPLGGWSLIVGALVSLVYSFRSQKQEKSKDLKEKKVEVDSHIKE